MSGLPLHQVTVLKTLLVNMFFSPGSKELNSKGMNVPGLDFQCLTTQANVVEANWAAGKWMMTTMVGSNKDMIMTSKCGCQGKCECAGPSLLSTDTDLAEKQRWHSLESFY